MFLRIGRYRPFVPYTTIIYSHGVFDTTFFPERQKNTPVRSAVNGQVFVRNILFFQGRQRLITLLLLKENQSGTDDLNTSRIIGNGIADTERKTG